MDKYIDSLAIIAHEFKTPINSIYNTAEIMDLANQMHKLSSEKVTEYAQYIRHFCNQLSLLTHNILDINTIGNDCAKCHYESIPLVQFIEGFQSAIDSYSLTLGFRIGYDIQVAPCDFLCDFEKLERMLLNLVSNAVKFNKSKTKRIKLIVTESETDLFFSVKDNGIGIPSNRKDKVLQKFFRVENFTTRETEGTGLGLSIVDTFAKLLQGELTFESKLGRGSVFTIRLPKKPDLGTAIIEPYSYYSLNKSTYDIELSNVRPVALPSDR